MIIYMMVEYLFPSPQANSEHHPSLGHDDIYVVQAKSRFTCLIYIYPKYSNDL